MKFEIVNIEKPKEEEETAQIYIEHGDVGEIDMIINGIKIISLTKDGIYRYYINDQERNRIPFIKLTGKNRISTNTELGHFE